MRLSCSSPMVPGGTLTARAEALRGGGFDAISVFYPFDRWGPAAREEIAGLEDRTGIVPCEFAFSGPLYGHLMDADPARRKASRAMYGEAARVCAELGAVTELEFEYGPQDPLPLFSPYQALDEGQREAFTQMYLEVLEPVQGTGARVLLEPVNRCESRYLNSVADCAGAVRDVSNPHAGLLLDFFHSSIEEASLAEAIRQAADLIFHVHLAGNNRLLPAMGNIDWAACLQVLRTAGFGGYLNLECSASGDPSVTLPATAAYLRALTSFLARRPGRRRRTARHASYTSRLSGQPGDAAPRLHPRAAAELQAVHQLRHRILVHLGDRGSLRLLQPRPELCRRLRHLRMAGLRSGADARRAGLRDARHPRPARRVLLPVGLPDGRVHGGLDARLGLPHGREHLAARGELQPRRKHRPRAVRVRRHRRQHPPGHRGPLPPAGPDPHLLHRARGPRQQRGRRHRDRRDDRPQHRDRDRARGAPRL